MRCDALAAIALVDKEEGLRASQFGKEEKCLSELHEKLTHNYNGWRDSVQRTYVDALLGWHE